MQSIQERSLENTVVPPGLRRRTSGDALKMFAHHMSENIIHTLKNEMVAVGPTVTGSDLGKEMFAEKMTSTVMAVALKEAFGVVQKLGEGKTFLNSNIDVVPDVPQLHQLPLTHSGLPLMGSLDYPDAPPTTPLLPELERSRSSFSRKLKGGLAQVFLPSPPPPTPKEEEEEQHDGSVEMIELLMQSLSTEAVVTEPSMEVEIFADALSCDIMDWLSFKSRRREEVPENQDLYQFAQRLADTIMFSSIHETQMLS